LKAGFIFYFFQKPLPISSLALNSSSFNFKYF